MGSPLRGSGFDAVERFCLNCDFCDSFDFYDLLVVRHGGS
jgi:hypothetical protein